MTELRSIYDYPEHLNPFYEKDNLKRLRFWKLGKHDENLSSDRRRRFSFGSLKSLLPLKSFRLSKRSSALGISKTSESPPPMRKDLWNYSFEEPNKYATYNPHFRSSVQGLESGNSSSLQSVNEFGFLNRSNYYRKTVQLGALRKNTAESYGFNTPTLRNRYKSPDISSRSSLNSINTNPFEVDYNCNSMKKPSRKKRQAPLPPKDFCSSTNKNQELKNDEFCRLTAKLTAEFETFVNEPEKENLLKTDERNNSERLLQMKIRAKTEEDSNQNSCDKEDEMSNTSLKIETDEMITEGKVREETPDYIPLTVREKFHLRIEEDFDSTNTKISENEANNLEMKFENDSLSQSRKSIVKQPCEIVGKKPDIFGITNSNSSLQTNLVKFNPKLSCLPSQPILKETHISESKRNSAEIAVDSVKFFKETKDSSSGENFYNSEFLKESAVEPIQKAQIQKGVTSHTYEKAQNEIGVKFKEFKSSLPPHQAKNCDSNSSRHSSFSAFKTDTKQILAPREETPIPISKTEYDISYARRDCFKINSYEDARLFEKEKKDRKVLPTPPPRRRSIKDVIESINRNQKLLKFNQTVPAQSRCYELCNQKSNDSLEKFQLQAESERKINEILEDLQNYRTTESLKDEYPKST